MPAIDIGTLFIGREDWEGNDGSGVAMEDDDDTDAEVGGYACNFLESFGSRRTAMKMTETSRDDEHEEDIMMRSMFEMLCEGKPLFSSSTPRPKRDRRRRPRRGRVGQIRRG